MALPVQRIPVRIARGAKSALDTALATGDLYEGELCYASDENVLYIVKSSALTGLGKADGIASNAATGGAGSVVVQNVVAISQADYDTLATADANTLYMIY